MSEWPASSWMARVGAPRIARCEQNVCRSTCTPGFTFARRGDSPHQPLNDLLRERLPFLVADHPRAAHMSRVPQGVGQALGQRHVPQPSALRDRHVSFPVGPRHAELPFLEIHVSPLQGHDFAASQSRFAAQQRDQTSQRIGLAFSRSRSYSSKS